MFGFLALEFEFLVSVDFVDFWIRTKFRNLSKRSSIRVNHRDDFDTWNMQNQ